MTTKDTKTVVREGVEKFRKKYEDYLGCAYDLKEDVNLGDEMANDINILTTSIIEATHAEVRERVQKMKIIRQIETASESACEHCGFNNDHAECMCLYNRAIDDILSTLEHPKDV